MVVRVVVKVDEKTSNNLVVSGTIQTTQIRYLETSGNIELDDYIVVAKRGATTLTLPTLANASPGIVYVIKRRTGRGIVTVETGTADDKIASNRGLTDTFELETYSGEGVYGITVVNAGDAWEVIATQ